MQIYDVNDYILDCRLKFQPIGILKSLKRFCTKHPVGRLQISFQKHNVEQV